MDEIVVRRFKQRVAEYYRETRKKILAEMAKGNLIHADETRIKLHAKTAYVWVFVKCLLHLKLVPRVGFMVTNLRLPGRAVVRFYNKRGTAEQ